MLTALWHEVPDLARLNAWGADGMHGHVGLEFTAFGDDWLTARLPVDFRTRQPFGLLHGGASVVAAEGVGSVAGSLTLDPMIKRVVGLEINANHVRAAREGFVHATATPEAIGRRTQVWSIRIVDDDDQVVCISRMTLAVLAVE